MTAAFFEVPANWGPASLKAAMAAHFDGTAEEKVPAGRLSVYDTFDWRLLRRGRLMVAMEGAIGILDLGKGSTLAAATDSWETPPRFWWQYPEGPLRALLADAVDIRGLMLRYEARKTTTALNLLDAEGKIVVRVTLDTVAAGGRAAHTSLSLIPVRGYRREMAAAAAVLTAEGCRPLSRHALVTAMEAAGLSPGGDQSRPDPALTPDTPAAAAVGMILARLARVIQENEAGIRGDIDTEFLHDFRVAVRRSRSLLTLVKGAIPQSVSDRISADLRAAGKATNAQRDMDVYLLDRGGYERLLPLRLRPALRPLFAALRRRRAAALKKTTAYLDSRVYRQALTHLTDPSLGAVSGESEAPLAGEPVAALARQVIAARYRKVVRAGRGICADTADEKVHRLRIECKKLRYALEFFSPLFPPADMALLIKQLKALQDHLGRFNDLAVQQAFLTAYLDGLRPAAAGSIGAAAAAGGLIGILYHEQQGLRNGFLDAFAAFDSPDNALRYRRLTSAKEPPQ